jgi:hypothetical protein
MLNRKAGRGANKRRDGKCNGGMDLNSAIAVRRYPLD